MRALAAVLLTLLVAAPAFAAKQHKPREYGIEAQINFANSGGIRTYHPDGDHALYIEDSRGHWYHAVTLGPCLGLEHAIGIGFLPGGTGTLDKWSSILVNGHRCYLRSLATAPSPAERRKARAEENASR